MHLKSGQPCTGSRCRVTLSSPRPQCAGLGHSGPTRTDTLQPDADLAQRISADAARRGLILLTCGTCGNVIRILVPFTATDALLDESLAMLSASFDSLAG